MILTRDTLRRKMALRIADPALIRKEIEWDLHGKVKSLTFAITDNDRFNYNVTLSANEVRELLEEYPALCPF